MKIVVIGTTARSRSETVDRLRREGHANSLQVLGNALSLQGGQLRGSAAKKPAAASLPLVTPVCG